MDPKPPPVPLPTPPAIGFSPILWLLSGSGVQMDGNRLVVWWQDLSGRGGHVTQPIEALRPAVIDGIFNGYPSIRFDGLDDFLSAAGWAAADDFTAFLIATPAASIVLPGESTSGTAGRTGHH